jgi:hypothetical protein
MVRGFLFQLVGWAKRPGANASGGVPTIPRMRSIQKMVGTAPRAPLPTLRSATSFRDAPSSGADPESSTMRCSGFRVRARRGAPRNDGTVWRIDEAP